MYGKLLVCRGLTERLVYELYGLTAEEVRLIEAGSVPSEPA